MNEDDRRLCTVGASVLTNLGQSAVTCGMTDFRPLRESGLWDLQRRFYQTHGTRAWRVTPHYVTNNPYIAAAYTDVILAFLRDRAASIDPAAPIYLVELGAGSGRLGYYVIEELLRRVPDFAVRGAPLRYVFTDVARENLNALVEHPRLAQHFAAGRADIALFDVEGDDSCTLIRAERTIARDQAANPLALISNYVFATVKQDLVIYDKGHVFEGLVDVQTTTTGDVVHDVHLAFDRRPIAGELFAAPSWNAVVRENAARYDRATLCFPSAALTAIDRVASMSRAGCLALVADRRLDTASVEAIDQTTSLKTHGGFSFSVDLDTLSRVLNAERWSTWRSDEPGRAFAVLAAVRAPLKDAAAPWSNTIDAVSTALVDGPGPHAFYALTQLLQRGAGHATLDEIRAFLQLSRYDTRVFQLTYERLRALLPGETQACRDVWRGIIDRVARTYFPVDDGTNPVFGFATLMLDMGFAARAADYFALSAHIVPHDRAAHLGLARASRLAGDRMKAEFALLRARQYSKTGAEVSEVDTALNDLHGTPFRAAGEESS